MYKVKWSELAKESAALARLASSFLFIGVEKGDFSVIAAAMVAYKYPNEFVRNMEINTASVFLNVKLTIGSRQPRMAP